MEKGLSQELYEGLCKEKRAVRALSVIIGAAPRLADRELLSAVQREERRHYYLLEGMYEEVAGKACETPAAAVSLPKNFCEMLKTQICDKLEAIDLYERTLPQLECLRLRELMQIILDDQKEHARVLAGIYQRCAP